MSKIDLFPEGYGEDFVDWIDKSSLLYPNSDQLDFIGRYDDRVAALQGPPGTGKTMTVAYAVLARAYARMADGERFRGLVVGPSNRSVHAVLEDVDQAVHHWDLHADDGAMDASLNDLESSRAINRKIELPDEEFRRTTWVNYQDDEDDDLDDIEEMLDVPDPEDDQSTLGPWGTGRGEGILIFATVTGAYQVVKKVFDDVPRPCFDLVAIDEASMLPVPQMLVPGSSTVASAQLLVSGDHRQMPPVQQHAWDREDRRIIEEVAPHLSTMDFFRLFTTKDSFGMAESPEEVDVPQFHPIPLDKLARTYRCAKTIAEFLRRLIYIQDNIGYYSAEEYDLATTLDPRAGVRRTTNKDSPLVLLVHDERQSQQSNPYEVGVIDAIVDGIDTDAEDVGVVTPHNAQRGRLRSELRDRIPTDSIDTVERFQGGEEDVIIMSGCVSDPDYIRQEAGFILSPNRLNVAMSRARKKLVVVVPRTLIEFVPSDSDEYEKARIWKKMQRIVQDEAEKRPWTGPLSEFAGQVPGLATDARLQVWSVNDIEPEDDGRRSG
jgi:uncharacterized protein